MKNEKEILALQPDCDVQHYSVALTSMESTCKVASIS